MVAGNNVSHIIQTSIEIRNLKNNNEKVTLITGWEIFSSFRTKNCPSKLIANAPIYLHSLSLFLMTILSKYLI